MNDYYFLQFLALFHNEVLDHFIFNHMNDVLVCLCFFSPSALLVLLPSQCLALAAMTAFKI
jgi:hypothetical protein